MKSCSFCDKLSNQVAHLVERASMYGDFNGNPRICDECIGLAIEQLHLAGITSFASGTATISARGLDQGVVNKCDCGRGHLGEHRADCVEFPPLAKGEERKQPILQLDVFIVEMCRAYDPFQSAPKHTLVLQPGFGVKQSELAVSAEQYEAVRESFHRGVPLALTLAMKDGE